MQDRLKIGTSLAKKSLDNFEDSNFVQLSEVKNGVLRVVNENTSYNFIGDEFARRTFDESGNYYVKSFRTIVKNTLTIIKVIEVYLKRDKQQNLVKHQMTTSVSTK